MNSFRKIILSSGPYPIVGGNYMNEGYIAVLDKISSISPTPGGGAVAALVLGHSYSLVSMVSQLTLKSDKWIKGHKISKNLKNISEKGILHSIDLANNDCIAFDNVMNSYRLPKNNEEEISIRKEKIIEASLEATTAPYDIAEKSLDLLLLLPDFAKYANKNALTDLASASQLAESAAYIASLNVKINTSNLSKEDSRKYNIKIKNILKESKSLNENIQKICSSRIGW